MLFSLQSGNNGTLQLWNSSCGGSGTSISFGSPIVFNNGVTIDAAYDSSDNRVVIVYRDMETLIVDIAIVGTITGNSIMYGSEYTFNLVD